MPVTNKRFILSFMTFPTLLVLAFAFFIYKEFDVFGSFLAQKLGSNESQEIITEDTSAFGKLQPAKERSFEDDVRYFSRLGEDFAIDGNWSWESSYVFTWVKTWGDSTELVVKLPLPMQGNRAYSLDCPSDKTVFISRYNKEVLAKQDYSIEQDDLVYAKCLDPTCQNLGKACFVVKMNLPEEEY